MLRQQIDQVPLANGNLYISGVYRDLSRWVSDIINHRITQVFAIGFHQWPPLPDLALPLAGQKIKSYARFIDDTATQTTLDQLALFIDEWADLIHSAIRAGERVLVHCMAGISRSSTVVIYYLMKHHYYSVGNAYDHVKKVRPTIQPNPAFVVYLYRYERKLVERYWTSRTEVFDRIQLPEMKVSIFWGPESIPNMDIGKEFARYNIRYCWLFGIPLSLAKDNSSITYASIFYTATSMYEVFCRYTKTMHKILKGGNSIYICSAQGKGIINVFIAFYLYRFHKKSDELLQSLMPSKYCAEILAGMIKTYSDATRVSRGP